VELTWLMRLRIAAAFAIGAVLIGVLAWPIAGRTTPFDVVSLAGGTVGVSEAVILVVLAFLAGIIAYFTCWPWGCEIGVIAAPAGLGIWAIRSANMANLFRENTSVAQQEILLSVLKFEPLLWLSIVAAGFIGVGICDFLFRTEAKQTRESVKSKPKEKPWQPGPYTNFFGAILGPIIKAKVAEIRQRIKQGREAKGTDDRNSKGRKYLNGVLAVVVSVVIAQFCIGVFVQDRAVGDRQMGLVAAQPAIGQIVFGVWISFGIAAFVVKKFLGAGYIWPAIASGIVTAFGIFTYMKHDTLVYLVEHWPPVFYSNAIMSILPIQMVAFGTLGSIWGYWLAVRYSYWREHGQSE